LINQLPLGENMGLFASEYFSTIHQILVVAHVLAAIFSLIVAPLVMSVKKGGRVHRQWGKAYFWGMFVTNIIALILLFYRYNVFLMGVTFLSFYGAITGYRVIYRKQSKTGRGVTWFDWGAAGVVIIAGIYLLTSGILAMLGYTRFIGIPSGGNVSFVFILLPLVFGIIITGNGWQDIQQFRQPITDRNWWWYYHMDRMLSSYIGLLTAFMVQQVGPRMSQNIAWIVWIAPAVIGTILISRWIGSYKQQFAR
jgi:hypothetical protein